MSDIYVNTASDKQARRADHIGDELGKEGLGHDQAEKGGFEQAAG